MSLTCWLDWDGDVTIVRIRGKIDTSTSPRLSRCLRAALIDGRAEMVLDMNEVTFIDAQGLGTLGRFFRDCRDRDRALALTNVSPFIRRLLYAVGFNRSLTILESVSPGPDGGPTRGTETAW